MTKVSKRWNVIGGILVTGIAAACIIYSRIVGDIDFLIFSSIILGFFISTLFIYISDLFADTTPRKDNDPR